MTAQTLDRDTLTIAGCNFRLPAGWGSTYHFNLQEAVVFGARVWVAPGLPVLGGVDGALL
jgi:hypothetical protein